MSLQPLFFPRKGKSGRKKLKMGLPYQKGNVLAMGFKGTCNNSKFVTPPRIKCKVNSGESPAISNPSGFRLEFIPMKIGAGMTFLEVALILNLGIERH